VVINGGDTPPLGSSAAIVIDLPRDRRITIFPSASPALATAALKALR
jgi:transposase